MFVAPLAGLGALDGDADIIGSDGTLTPTILPNRLNKCPAPHNELNLLFVSFNLHPRNNLVLPLIVLTLLKEARRVLPDLQLPARQAVRRRHDASGPVGDGRLAAVCGLNGGGCAALREAQRDEDLAVDVTFRVRAAGAEDGLVGVEGDAGIRGAVGGGLAEGVGRAARPDGVGIDDLNAGGLARIEGSGSQGEEGQNGREEIHFGSMWVAVTLGVQGVRRRRGLETGEHLARLVLPDGAGRHEDLYGAIGLMWYRSLVTLPLTLGSACRI